MIRAVPVLLLAAASAAVAQSPPVSTRPPVRALIVTAHPDDDAAFAGTVYQITHQLGGVADLALVTDGSGGFRYATLAEPIYGMKLTDEAVAREYLPAIRKRELMAGGAIAGIRNYFFLDQLDHEFTLNADSVLRVVWDSAFVRRRLTRLMEENRYDVVFGLVPSAGTHGHHKAATILAIEAAQSLPAGRRPVVLAGFPCTIGGQALTFSGLPEYPKTTVTGGTALTRFDLTQKFGHNERLDFKIIVNWVIAEHKSQGTMQLLMGQSNDECYWYFDVNGPDGRAPVLELFEALRVPR